MSSDGTFSFARLNWFPLVCGAFTILLGQGWRREFPIIAIAGPAFIFLPFFGRLKFPMAPGTSSRFFLFVASLLSGGFSGLVALWLLARRARIEQRYDT